MAETETLLMPMDEYLKAGFHIGTKFRTKGMGTFIYKVRPDGLAVLNVQKINKRILLGAKFLAQYNPEDIIIACRRENGWHTVKLFSGLTGIKSYTGRYPPGILTNPNLKNFIEAKLILVCDPQPDRNVVNDAKKVGIPIIALCDTNNEIKDVDFVIPCNNKGKKSLGLLFYVLAREYMKARGLIKSDKEFKNTLEDFTPPD